MHTSSLPAKGCIGRYVTFDSFTLRHAVVFRVNIGCGDAEAAPFSDQADFKDSRIELVGVSADPVDQLKSFADKHNVSVRCISFVRSSIH